MPRAIRVMCGTVLAVGGLATLFLASGYRSIEGAASASLADMVSPRYIWSSADDGSTIFVGRPVDLAFVITPSCSSMIIAVIFFFGSALLAAFAPRFRLRRILTAFGVASVLAVIVNIARVLLIILATSQWSRGIGFRLSHEYVGSLLTVFGMALALLVYLIVLARDRSSVRTT